MMNIQGKVLEKQVQSENEVLEPKLKTEVRNTQMGYRAEKTERKRAQALA